jgi:predicted LPLAT superfamily acyltransferase
MMPSNTNTDEKQHWSGLKEAGTYRGLLFLLWVHKTFGRGIFSIVLYPVMIYFYLFRRVSREASQDFLATHYSKFPDQWKQKPGALAVIKHQYAFAQSILDKILAWSSDMNEEEFIIANEEELKAFLAQDNGQLIIGSHLGNLEYCRGFVHRYKNKIINALVYDQHSANFVNMLQSINPDSRIHIYQVDALDIPTILTLKNKIEAGEWLFIAGDRIPLSGDSRTVAVDFIGRKAQLPIGPYMLAKVLACEVKLMFSYRVNKKVYFEMVPFADKVVLSRKNSDQDLQRYAQQFATELERQCKNAPLQWFNFYPYWADAKDQAA